MNAKLTLKLDADVIEKAKHYAAHDHKSLSKMVENYFRILTEKKEPEEERMTPLVRELSGIIRMKKGQDVKAEYADYLAEKYK